MNERPDLERAKTESSIFD